MAQALEPTLKILLSHRSLTSDEAREAFEIMMRGEATEAEMGALLAILALRIPTSEELLGAAKAMRQHVTAVPTDLPPGDILDTAGTGGAPKTFNVSTAAALVAAGAGIKVAKHGNRSRTGRGSAEVLEGLGVQVNASPAVQARCLQEAGVCFCFAIHHHPATRNVMPVRRALGIPTLFNLLGPLTNPANAGRQMLGVYDGRFLLPMAHALHALGTQRAIVLHSDDGLDEVSISAPTTLIHVSPEGIRQERITPEDFGLPRAAREHVVARDLGHATDLVRAILDGSEQGAPRDMTLLSAGVALLTGGGAENLATGVELARQTLESGGAQRTLERLVSLSQQPDKA